MKSKNSIAFVVWNESRDKVLAVQRPSDDDILPDVWGLPAGSLREEETFENCVIRSGKEKLGVEVEIVKLVGEGEIERDQYTLHLKEFEVKIITGEPSVPQDIQGVTQYQNRKWAEPNIFVDAAKKGSLCSRLFLGSLDIQY